MTLTWPASVHYRPESTSCHPLPNEGYREQPRHIVADHDNPTRLASYAYGYESLTSTDEIRVLELSKGKAEDPLHGTLTSRRLQNFAAYEALSYTWASHDGGEPLNGAFWRDMIYLGPSWDTFLLTRNCYKALHRLRYPDRTRVLWVDSICINQENQGERSHQVWLMQKIYKNALSVVVYLGDEDADSSVALETLRSPEHLLSLTRLERNALTALFRRPYFSRLWIVQEVVLAKSLHFYCGSSETFIPIFSGSTLELLLTLRKTAPAWMRYSALRQSAASRSLWSLLQDTNSCRCSDPRDKIFGILSLAIAESEKDIKPDYSLSVEEVYTGIAAFLVGEVGLLSVLELATRTPPLKSLPSWAPNWAVCNTTSRRRIPSPISNLSNTTHWALYLDWKCERRICSKLCCRKSRDYLSSHVSVTGTITVEGILFTGHASHAEHAKYHPLLLQSRDRMLNIAFHFAEKANDSTDLRKTDSFIRNHQSVLLLGGNYSHALVLEPIDGKKEFTLLKVGEIRVTIYPEYYIPLPELLCLLPISAEELAFIRNGVISRPDEFPRIRDLNLLWATRKDDPEGYWDEKLVKVLKCLLSSDFLKHYETGTKIWARWQEFERECMPTVLDPASMESIANHIRSLKGSSDWNEFRKDLRMVSRKMQCRVTRFLSLFILDPFQGHVTARDTAMKSDSSNEGVGHNVDPRRALDRLSDWAMYTFDLLDHIESSGEGSTPFAEKLPGQDLPVIARKTWAYHSSIAEVACRGNPFWNGMFTWFMAKKIARQQLETKNLQGRDPGRKLLNGLYWDWDHMKTAMEERMAVLKELMEFRRRFEHERGDCNVDSLAHKLGTRRLMKEVGYDLDDDRMLHRSITIR